MEYMKQKAAVIRLSLALPVLFALSGCVSVETAITSRVDGLFADTSAIPDVPDIDYSYPVTGDVAEQGAVIFKFKPGFWEKLFHNPAPPVPADESEVIVYLGFASGFQWISSWVPPERSGGIGAILWGDVSKYVGNCDILFGTASHAGKLVIRKESDYPSDEEKQRGVKGATRTIVFDRAATADVSVEMNNFIVVDSTIHVVRSIPPNSWGELVLGGRAYRIFSVMEENYYVKYPDFSQRERGTERNGIVIGYLGSRVETTANNFLKSGQKFQITDNARTVVAELQGDAYMLYDTLPEAERDRMKQALALFYAFRYIARGLL
jgi:hypothetical protein